MHKPPFPSCSILLDIFTPPYMVPLWANFLSEVGIEKVLKSEKRIGAGSCCNKITNFVQLGGTAFLRSKNQQ